MNIVGLNDNKLRSDYVYDVNQNKSQQEINQKIVTNLNDISQYFMAKIIIVDKSYINSGQVIVSPQVEGYTFVAWTGCSCHGDARYVYYELTESNELGLWGSDNYTNINWVQLYALYIKSNLLS